MQISFARPTLPKSGTVLVPLSSKTLKGLAKELDEASGGTLTRAMKAQDFKAEEGEVCTLLAPTNLKLDRILIFGLGRTKLNEEAAWLKLGGQMTAVLARSKITKAALLANGLGEAAVLGLAEGAVLRSYSFDIYLTRKTKEDKKALESFRVFHEAHKTLEEVFAPRRAVLDGVKLTRDLTSEPANILTPKAFAKRIKGLEKLGLDVEILDEKALKKMGFHALLAVGQGSEQPSQVAIMKWAGKSGGAELQDPIAFIGKGVTFDSGGISIKPAQGMEQMKWDMGGAGIVTGVMAALAGRKAAVDAVGLVGLVENMPSGTAQRPGDVISSLAGKSIEVLNTDAEGRLVLADVLHYAQETYQPCMMIDLATLTGAMIISLGHDYAGFFTDSDTLAKQLSAAGQASADRVWRLPLDPAYDKLLDSPIADMQNIGGRAAGSITAAQFLKRFVNIDNWAHIDVAGVVWADKPGDLYPKGATGFGVRLLDRLVADHYE